MTGATLPISETFLSLQGEGAFVGMPSFFIRVSGCNLRCVWCDTPYASWNPEGEPRPIEAILEEAKASGAPHIVVTGGEPMLFDAIERLCSGLRRAGVTITIETAGTIFRELECDLMSISPKLSNSAPPENTPNEWHRRHESTRLQLDELRRLIETYHCQLKFVVNPEGEAPDLEEIEALLAQVGGIETQCVVLMAEGTDTETQLRRQRLLVPVCLERGWRLTPRMHIDLFGNQKGT